MELVLFNFPNLLLQAFIASVGVVIGVTIFGFILCLIVLLLPID